MGRTFLTHAALLDGDNPVQADRTVTIDGDRIVAVRADGQRAWVTNFGGSSVSVLDLTTNPVSFVHNIALGQFVLPAGIAIVRTTIDGTILEGAPPGPL